MPIRSPSLSHELALFRRRNILATKQQLLPKECVAKITLPDLVMISRRILEPIGHVQRRLPLELLSNYLVLLRIRCQVVPLAWTGGMVVQLVFAIGKSNVTPAVGSHRMAVAVNKS